MLFSCGVYDDKGISFVLFSFSLRPDNGELSFIFDRISLKSINFLKTEGKFNEFYGESLAG